MSVPDRQLAAIGVTGVVSIIGVAAGLEGAPQPVMTMLFILVLGGVGFIIVTAEEEEAANGA